MRLTNSGEYMVNVFGVILAPNESLEGADCEAKLYAHPELINSIGCNGLVADAEAEKVLGIKKQPTEDEVEKKAPEPKKK